MKLPKALQKGKKKAELASLEEYAVWDLFSNKDICYYCRKLTNCLSICMEDDDNSIKMCKPCFLGMANTINYLGRNAVGKDEELNDFNNILSSIIEFDIKNNFKKTALDNRIKN